jgi:large subunit ribosomal protein L13
MATKVYNMKDADRKWYVLNADGEILGRLATVAADLLRGKKKATYTPNMDSGDNVIVINAGKIKLSTEAKNEDKAYYRHSGYPGGIKKETFAEAMEKRPERVITLAVKGMLQSNKLAASQLKRLRVYAGNEHAHTQDMIEVDLKGENK